MKGEREKKMKLRLVNKGFEKEKVFLSKTTTRSSRCITFVPISLFTSQL